MGRAWVARGRGRVCAGPISDESYIRRPASKAMGLGLGEGAGERYITVGVGFVMGCATAGVSSPPSKNL